MSTCAQREVFFYQITCITKDAATDFHNILHTHLLDMSFTDVGVNIVAGKQLGGWLTSKYYEIYSYLTIVTENIFDCGLN